MSTLSCTVHSLLSVQIFSLKRSEIIIQTLAILFCSLRIDANALFVCALHFIGREDQDASRTDS